MSDFRYPHLFEPIVLGRQFFRNRIFNSPTGVAIEPERYSCAYYERKAIGGAAIVKAFGMEQRELDRFSKANGDFFRRQVKIIASKSAVNPLMEFFAAVAACLLLVYANHNHLELSDVVMFIVAMVAMTPLITIQLLGFRSIAAALIRHRRNVRRIVAADDEQIISFR